MVRLARRKAGTAKTRYSLRRAQAIRAMGKTHGGAKKAKKASPTTPIYIPKIKSLMSNINSYSQKRKKQFGANDACARKLSHINKKLSMQLRKSNIINSHTTTCLQQVNPALRGIATAPKIIRTTVPQLQKTLRQTVHQDVVNFLNMMTRTLTPMQTELLRLNRSLNHQVKMCRNGKVPCKVDPALRTRFNALNRKFSNFKTQWNGKLNKLQFHGNATVRQSVVTVKKQLDQIQMLIRKNLTILNRYTKVSKPVRGKAAKPIFTAGQINGFETRFNRISMDLGKCRNQVDWFFDGLKAVK